MKRTRLAAVIGTAAFAAAGLGAGAAIGGCASAAHAPAPASAPGDLAYSYYQSMMGRLIPGSSGASGMMGGPSSRSSMMGAAGYRWTMGGLAAPAWMRGYALPDFMTGRSSMMGASSDPGTIMGALFANAPGPRVSQAEAARLGGQIPAAATVSRAQKRITFSGATARFTILASPAGGPAEAFRIAGMTNPVIVVPAGTHVSIEVINTGSGAARGLVITASMASSPWMPMMTARPAFRGAALWFLGVPTSAGAHTGTVTFTAGVPGTYRYLSPVPGQARSGMTGTFIVR
jgi:rusticyanin